MRIYLASIIVSILLSVRIDIQNILPTSFRIIWKRGRSDSGTAHSAGPASSRPSEKRVHTICLAAFEADQPLSSPPEIKKPPKNRGLKIGAGEEGRTPDLMLGKHGRGKKVP